MAVIGVEPEGYGTGFLAVHVHVGRLGVRVDPLLTGELYGLAELAVHELGQVAVQSLKFSFVASHVGVGLGSASFLEAEPCGHVLLVGNRRTYKITRVYVDVEGTEDRRQGEVDRLTGVYGARVAHEGGGVGENDSSARSLGLEGSLVDYALAANLQRAARSVGGEGGGRAVVAAEGHHAVGLDGYSGVGDVVCQVGLDDDARTVGFLEHESVGATDHDIHVRSNVDFLELEHGGVDILAVEVVAALYLSLAVFAGIVEPRCSAGIEHEFARCVFQGLYAHVADYGDGAVARVDVAEHDLLGRVYGDASAAARFAAAGTALGLKLARIGYGIALDADGTARARSVGDGVAVSAVRHDIGGRSEGHVAGAVRFEADRASSACARIGTTGTTHGGVEVIVPVSCGDKIRCSQACVARAGTAVGSTCSRDKLSTSGTFARCSGSSAFPSARYGGAIGRTGEGEVGANGDVAMIACLQSEGVVTLDLHDHGTRQVDPVEGEGAYGVGVIQAAG